MVSDISVISEDFDDFRFFKKFQETSLLQQTKYFSISILVTSVISGNFSDNRKF